MRQIANIDAMDANVLAESMGGRKKGLRTRISPVCPKMTYPLIA